MTRPLYRQTLSARLAAARSLAGLTLDGVAYLVEVDRQTVYRWERGLRLPDAYSLARLAVALDVDPRELLLLPSD